MYGITNNLVSWSRYLITGPAPRARAVAMVTDSNVMPVMPRAWRLPIVLPGGILRESGM
jgi:hypothetical protein